MLVVELADTACWEALMALAQRAGEATLAQQFEQARLAEQEHLTKVHAWLLQCVSAPPITTASCVPRLLPHVHSLS
jgi:hypothetical protein